MIAPARLAAYDALAAVSANRASLATAIATSRARLGDDRDRALASEIATGVQRWRAALDHVIQLHSSRPVARLDTEVLDVLRLGTYQLLHLTRVPASAVVDDAVSLAKRAGKQSAGGLVNAVLRAVSRQRRQLALPERPDAPVDLDRALDYLSVTLSHPRWLAARWLDRLGLVRTEAWMQFNNQAAPLALRANPQRTSRDDLRATLASIGIATTPGRFAPDAVILERGHTIRSGRGRAEGPRPDQIERLFAVQDEASQLVALLAGPRPGPWVLDTCAAPGGKVCAIAASVGAGGGVVACDVRERRLGLLRRTVTTQGAGNVRLVQCDALRPLPFAALFDVVVVDAPCSGLGTLRRDPDIRWRRQEADLAPFADRALGMLVHAAACVAAGGRLVYATCSSEPEENECVAEAFLSGASDFAGVDARTVHPALPPAVVDADGHLRTTPDEHALECFFGAVFERRRNRRSHSV